MIYGHLYIIQNLINNKFYVGQTTQIPILRWKQHINSPTKTSAIDNAIKKYGENNFSFVIIDIADNQEELNNKEEEYICLFGSKNIVGGYNIRNGGSNGRHNIRTLKKMSNSKLKEKNHNFLNLDDQRIIELYESGFTTIEIAKKMGCTHQTISEHLKWYNYQLRSKRECNLNNTLFGFKGISLRKNRNLKNKPWESYISFNGRKKFLGSFHDPLTGELIYNLVKNEIMEI